MPQAIYSVAALLLLGISFFNVNQKVHGTEERMVFSELALQMTNVGSELLSEIERYPYDPVALKITTQGILSNRAALRDAATFGTGSTCDPNTSFSGCLFINDFHGKTATRTITRAYKGTSTDVVYTATYSVRYVTEAAPHTPTAAKTFSKEVTLTLSTPALTFGDATTPIEVQVSRVYSFPNY